jgi:predicted type IV restriction endonuclease
MDFIDKIRELAARVSKQLEHIQTEEATKNALIMPFIAALGYNVFDPTEVTPELNADVGIKKGEKVDYAILRESKPIILFECKHHAADLGKIHASQLYRYFSVTTARFGVLTNGIVYWFFTDLEAPNKMDAKPFFEFNLLDIKEQAVEELKKFTKSAFDLNNILTTASELKYTREIRRIMAEQMQDPSDEFVKFFAAQVYQGDKSAEVVPSSSGVAETPTPESEAAMITSAEELDGFYIVKALLREVIEVKRIVMRDVQSYCGILLDDNNRKPICRLHFNASQRYVSFFDDQKDTRMPIAQVDDLYKHADRLKATVARYETKGAPQKAPA